MIKINLCPVDELESPYWYVPDVAVLLVAAIAAYVGVQYHFGLIEEETATVQAEAQAKKDAYQRLEEDVRPFKTLPDDIAALKAKITALQSITVSKISRYRPVIVAEHFQNVKPEGVWFSDLRIGSKEDPHSYELKGQAFDNILVSELMTSMRATQAQEKDDADLRTQVYFSEVTLLETGINGTNGRFPELALYPEFQLRGRFKERGEADAPPGGDVAPGPGAPPRPAPAPATAPVEVSTRPKKPGSARF